MSTVTRTKENLQKCQCMKCPTYTFMCKMKSMPGNIMAMMSDIGKKDHMEAMVRFLMNTTLTKHIIVLVVKPRKCSIYGLD